MSIQTVTSRVKEAVSSAVGNQDWTRSLLLAALLLLSWWSTTQGLLALIAAGNGAPGLLVKGTIGFAVGVLTVLISWTVNRLRVGGTGMWAPAFVFGYALLTLISVGFGFGFYWTHIESRASAQRVAQEETERLSRTLNTAYGSLAASMEALDAVAQISEARAVTETNEGGTCGIGGVAGPGPRYRLRMNDAATMRALRDQISRQVGGNLSAQRSQGTTTLLGAKAALDVQLLRLEQGAFAAMDHQGALGLLTDTQRALANTIDQYEAFRTGAAVTGAVTLLEDRVARGRGVMVDGQAKFTCPDPALEVVMTQAAQTLAQLPPLPLTKLEVPIGADATVAAFGKLANTALKPLLGEKAGPVLAGRDLVPLGVAVAVDLFILLLSVQGRMPPGARDPSAVAAWLDRPDAIRELVGDAPGAEMPSHTELLEHTFWWRDSYHLALPVAGAGEGPVTAVQQGLTLMAMVLTDAGLLTPVNRRIGKGALRQKLLQRFGRTRTWGLRRSYDLYRFEENGLARMTSLLLSGQPDVQTSDALDQVPDLEEADWRMGLYPVRKPQHARSLENLAPKATAADRPAENEPPKRPGVKPSAYWRSLNPIPKKPEDEE